jgi:hypothetical protein
MDTILIIFIIGILILFNSIIVPFEWTIQIIDYRRIKLIHVLFLLVLLSMCRYNITDNTKFNFII